MRLIPLAAALVLALSASALAQSDVKLEARTTVSGDTFDSTILVRGSRQRVERANDPIITLFQCDQHRMVQLNPQTKAYRIVALDVPAGASLPVRPLRTPRSGAGPTVTFTTTFTADGADQKMRGFLAHRFISKTEAKASPNSCSQAESVKLATSGWYADLPGSDLSCADPARASLRLRRVDPACTERTQYRVEGDPPAGLALELETTMTTSSGPVTTKQVTIALDEAHLAAELFEIPADYRLVRTDEELLSGPSQTASPAPADPASTPRPRPTRSTRSGIPRPALTKICLMPVADPGGEGNTPSPTLLFGTQLNRQGLETIPVSASHDAEAAKEANDKGCPYLLSVEVTHAPPDSDHPDAATKGEFILTPLDAAGSTPWQQTFELQKQELREAFFERAAKAIAAEIHKRRTD